MAVREVSGLLLLLTIIMGITALIHGLRLKEIWARRTRALTLLSYLETQLSNSYQVSRPKWSLHHEKSRILYELGRFGEALESAISSKAAHRSEVEEYVYDAVWRDWHDEDISLLKSYVA